MLVLSMKEDDAVEIQVGGVTIAKVILNKIKGQKQVSIGFEAAKSVAFIRTDAKVREPKAGES
jgi:sRNA-binding carbon storage regulator CsrA